MEERKVIITAYYISTFGTIIEEKYEQDDLASAKAYIEQNMPTIARPKYDLAKVEKEEDGKQYDVTRFTSFQFSYLDIVDYTDGHEVATEIKNNENL